MILLGFDPVEAVPAILLTQAVAGVVGAFWHHKRRNAQYTFRSRDMKIVLVICGFGMLAVMTGSIVLVSVPTMWVTAYIGVIVTVMGVLVISRWTSRFSWMKMVFLGIVSSFNKGLSGGGFGPIATGGQIISGNGARSAVGVTTLAEVPICLIGFVATISLLEMRGDANFSASLYCPMLIGAVCGASLGPHITAKLPGRVGRRLIGLIMILLGMFTIVELW